MESKRKSTKEHARSFVYKALTDPSGEPDASSIILICCVTIFIAAVVIYYTTAWNTGNGIVLPDKYTDLIVYVIIGGFLGEAARYYAHSKVERTEVIEEARLRAKEANGTEVGVIARQRAQNAKMYPDVNKDKPTDFYKGLTDRGPDPYFDLYGPPREDEQFEKEPKSYL